LIILCSGEHLTYILGVTAAASTLQMESDAYLRDQNPTNPTNSSNKHGSSEISLI